MALDPDKSRRYLRWAVENDKRAGSTVGPELKGMFRRIAAQYRDLALQIENPEQSFMFHALPRTTFVAWTPARIAL
jgi:hypothetical protein